MDLVVLALVAAVFVFAGIVIVARLPRRGLNSGDGASSTWMGNADGSNSHHGHHSHHDGGHGGFGGHDGGGGHGGH